MQETAHYRFTVANNRGRKREERSVSPSRFTNGTKQLLPRHTSQWAEPAERKREHMHRLLFRERVLKPGLRGRDSKEVPILGNWMLRLGGGAVFFYFGGSGRKICKVRPAALPYVISKYLFTRF